MMGFKAALGGRLWCSGSMASPKPEIVGSNLIAVIQILQSRFPRPNHDGKNCPARVINTVFTLRLEVERVHFDHNSGELGSAH